MNSTDKEQDGDLASLYEREFAATAKRLSERGVQLIAPGPDPSCATYYVERQRIMTRADFTLELDDTDDVKRAFHQLWTDVETSLLADLLERILALSVRQDSLRPEQDVSAFIYAMF
jgi:hypothetical protein